MKNKIEFEEVPKVQLPKKMSYFNVKEAYYALFSELEDNMGELTDDLEARIKELDIKLEDKMHSIFFIKKEKENDILMLKDEVTRLTGKVKSITNVISKVKEIGLDAVLEFGANGKSGNKTLKYPDLSIWTVNRESLVVPENLSDAIAYGKDLLLEGEEELATKDGKLFKYTITISDLCPTCTKDIIKAIETVHAVYLENVTLTINIDEVKERIRYNQQLLDNPTLFDEEPGTSEEVSNEDITDVEFEDTRLKNVLDYKLITKPSVTFK